MESENEISAQSRVKKGATLCHESDCLKSEFGKINCSSEENIDWNC
jgi:hypothetical protein